MTAVELFPAVMPGAEMVPGARVYAVDGVVHIRDLATVDPDLRGLVQTANDPEAVVQHALSTGARALAIAQASIDTRLVEDSFAKLLESLRVEIAGAGTTVSSATGDLLNHPTAGVAASLAQWRGTIETLMDFTFNPGRSTSAFGKLDQILADANTDQLNATRRLLNPDTDDSPTAQLLASVQSQISTVLVAVSMLSDRVAGDSAAKIAVSAAMERSAVKGTSSGSRSSGPSPPSRPPAATSPRAPAGPRAATADSSATLWSPWICPASEASTAATFWNARTAGSASGPSSTNSPRPPRTGRPKRRSPSSRSPSTARSATRSPSSTTAPSCCSTRTTRTPSSLRLGCMWARWVVQRESQPGDQQVDVEEVQNLLEDGRRILGRRANIRRARSIIVRKIEETAEQVDEMHDGFAPLIEKIEQRLRG